MSQAGASSSSPPPPPSSGALVLVQTQIASGVTALPFTGLSASYNNYLLYIDNFTTPDNNAPNLVLQISTDGGATYIATGYDFAGGPNIGSSCFAAPSATSNVNIRVDIHNLTSGVGYINTCSYGTYFESFIGLTAPLSVNIGGGTYGGYDTPNTAANAFNLVLDTGSAFSGTFSLYGYLV